MKCVCICWQIHIKTNFWALSRKIAYSLSKNRYICFLLLIYFLYCSATIQALIDYHESCTTWTHCQKASVRRSRAPSSKKSLLFQKHFTNTTFMNWICMVSHRWNEIHILYLRWHYWLTSMGDHSLLFSFTVIDSEPGKRFMQQFQTGHGTFFLKAISCTIFLKYF